MLREEEERLLEKLDEMEKYLVELKEMLPKKGEYLSNLIKRRACEKTIELAIESLIDVCSMILSFEKLGIPSDEDNIFDILTKKNVFPNNFSSKLKKMKGFRKIIVHKYGEVNESLVYAYISENLNGFDEFKEFVLNFLKKVDKT